MFAPSTKCASIFFTVALLSISLLLPGCATPNQHLQLGVNAFNQGKYDIAANHWNPLAKNGNLFAQYNLGLLWESGLGRTPKNKNEAANWYFLSAQQGYVPAMVRLAHIQKTNGYEEAAHSWYTLAARWGDQDAIAALSALGVAIPEADLLKKKQIQDEYALEQKQIQDQYEQQQVAEALIQAASSIGYALGGGTRSSGYRQPSLSSSTTSPTGPSARPSSSSATSSTNKSCLSDFSCGVGYTCVKAPLKNRGICLRSVDQDGMRQFNQPSSHSVGPNMNLDGQCTFNLDCPLGFICDQKYKACVKR